MHKGLVVWIITVILWQFRPAKMKKSRKADSSGGTGFISCVIFIRTIHVQYTLPYFNFRDVNFTMITKILS